MRGRAFVVVVVDDDVTLVCVVDQRQQIFDVVDGRPKGVDLRQRLAPAAAAAAAASGPEGRKVTAETGERLSDRHHALSFAIVATRHP